MLVEGEVFIEKLHGGKGTYVAITKFAYISPTATPTRAYAKNRLQFWFFAANFYYLQMSGTLHLWQVSCEIRLPVFAYGLPTST